jgi:crotonobetainyl-CoA:carnitine CoA-transferase CaiB-like acyl-CoA transferase
MLATGVCAAVAKRALTGEASTVDVSLLGAAMWSMQRLIAQATDQGVATFARPAAGRPNNVLSYTYKTSDSRFIALCMLQADRYWAPFCDVAGRSDLASDLRFIDAQARRENVEACVAELNALFASKTLAEWREILARQGGQWEAVQHVGELAADGQVRANHYIQSVATTAGRAVPLVSVPMQFDGAAFQPEPAPDIGADSDTILAELGYDEDGVIDLKIAGVVF